MSAQVMGLHYYSKFIDRNAESVLIDRVRHLPLEPFQFGEYQARRRVISFGSRYDSAHQRIDQAPPVPEWLRPLVTQIEHLASLAPGSIAHALVTEYAAGAGIGWHRDKSDFERVFGLSLGSSCTLRFRKKAAAKWLRYNILAEPCSLYAVSGEARHSWEHSIPAVESLRYSVTFRTMAETRGPK